MEPIHNLYFQGLSTSQVAKALGKTKASVKQYLYTRGLLRRALGRDIEEEVAIWLEKEGYHIVRQKGDHHFDLLVDGKKVDVKSSKVHFDKSDGSYSYCFEIRHKQNLNKDIADLDYFFLVFISETSKSLYKLRANEVKVKRILKISNIDKTKYKLKYIGEV